MQTRGQLAAGVTSYDSRRDQILVTRRDVGSVSEVFQVSRPATFERYSRRLRGSAAIGHTRYATTGGDSRRYAQPFERRHGRLWKWFSFAFNGTLSNYRMLRNKLKSEKGYHFMLDTDTEVVQHYLAYALRGQTRPDLRSAMELAARDFDGAYCLVFLDADGRLMVARDPLGFRPLSWGVQDGVFAAASESAALANIGFRDVRSVEPGQMVIVENGEISVERYAPRDRRARCYFEWVYFSNVASAIDGVGVYESRSRAGEILADRETTAVDERTIVVPVPDTAKAAADAYAFRLGARCVEGVFRNRYVGRTFIQTEGAREDAARSKYTPLPSVLAGKRVFLIEDSIVRSTTLKVLVSQIRERGHAREIHVRVACPPIVAPCFYGIDLSTPGELFAADRLGTGRATDLTADVLHVMARDLGVDSIRYLSIEDTAAALGVDEDSLCLGCVTRRYPTEWGNRLHDAAGRPVVQRPQQERL